MRLYRAFVYPMGNFPVDTIGKFPKEMRMGFDVPVGDFTSIKNVLNGFIVVYFNHFSPVFLVFRIIQYTPFAGKKQGAFAEMSNICKIWKSFCSFWGGGRSMSNICKIWKNIYIDFCALLCYIVVKERKG